MQLPNVLLVDRLLKPANMFTDRMTRIKNEIKDAEPESESLKGLFVMAISSFEIMLLDTYKYFTENFPGASDIKPVTLTKDSILDAAIPAELIEKQVEQHLIKLSYGRFIEFFKSIIKAFGIKDTEFENELLDRIVEAKETRNLLLHNDLIVNSVYTEKAGAAARPKSIGEKLSLDAGYISSRISDVESLTENLISLLSQKFGDYTQLRAFRQIWSFLFSSPIMMFDDYWEVDETKGRVVAFLSPSCENGISSSERMFLSVLRQHFHGPSHEGVPIIMYYLDTKRRNQMLYLLGILHDFRI